MRLWMAPLALLAACGFGNSATPDAHPDAPPPDAQMCFGSYVTTCFNTVADLPAAPKTFPANADIDTDSTDPAMCNQSHDQKTRYCVVSGAGITVAAGATIRAHGTKPLVLISTMAVDLEGNIDVSSVGAMLTMQGAGANPSGLCTGGTQADGNAGGAGGSFAGKGGTGESVNSGTLVSPAPATSFPSALRGGCRGGDGKKALLAGGAGGSGGGAVAIVAPSVMIGGTINASGAGGGGGPQTVAAETAGGAGGGGSGGMIVIEVATNGLAVGANGLLIANGGGGGEGGGSMQGQDGSVSMAPMTAAAGGNGGGDGGNGGAGSAGSNSLDGATSPGMSKNMGGGGAGGGGAGFIHAPGAAGDAVISPPSQNLPGLPA